MRILIISNYFSPGNSPRSLRWTAIAEYWAKNGDEVYVVSKAQNCVKRYEKENQVEIYRVGLDFSRVKSLISNEATLKKSIKFHFNIKEVFLRIIKVLWRFFYWPDSSMFWIFPAYIKSRNLLRNKNFDLLITVSHPFSSHLVGLLLKKDKSIKWVADSGDPYSLELESPANNLLIWKKLNLFVERKLLHEVDLFSVTTDTTLNLYELNFEKLSNKIIVIPPLYRPVKFDNTKSFTNQNKILFLYVGTFYQITRPPVVLIDFFEKVIKLNCFGNVNVELNVIGQTDLFNRELNNFPFLKEHIKLLGEKPNKEVQNYIMSANYLVNIGNKTPYQVPSKIIEYMSSGKPIINIEQCDFDTSSRVLQNYPLRYIFRNSVNMNDNKNLCFYLHENHGKILMQEEIDLLLAPYNLEFVANKYKILFS